MFDAFLDRAGHDVVIQTGTEVTDRYGNTILDWSAPAVRTVKAWISQTSTIEILDHRDATVTDAAGFFHLSAKPASKERVVDAGAVYEIVGTPNPCPSPRGSDHCEVALRAVNG